VDVTERNEKLERGTAVRQSNEKFYYIPGGVMGGENSDRIVDRYALFLKSLQLLYGIFFYWRQLPQRPDWLWSLVPVGIFPIHTCIWQWEAELC